MVAIEPEWRERIRRETREGERDWRSQGRRRWVLPLLLSPLGLKDIAELPLSVLCCSCSFPRCYSVLFVTVVAIAAAAVIVAAAGSGRSHRTIVLITPFHFMGCSAHISTGSPF
ncbi:hypothetical protein S83_017198 [Arachis hypogaea]|nr:uncharacterized protein DS421_5g163610 [Arachis hypogaea]